MYLLVSYSILLFLILYRHISTTVDPIWDTSLNLVTEHEHASKSHVFSQIPQAQPQPRKLRPEDVISLDECLERYTQLEHLEGVTCHTCQCNQTATKQLAFNEIPMILLLHLKVRRFNIKEEILNHEF